jgi:alpha-N-arabinofuranosidase
MREGGRMIEVDLHHYTLAGSWAAKGPARGFTEAQWFARCEMHSRSTR